MGRQHGDANMTEAGLVELQGFNLLSEAEVAASVLNASGIESSVREEFFSGSHPDLVTALGGVSLLVRAEDLDIARQLLSAAPADSQKSSRAVESQTTEGAAVCAGCGGELPNALAECRICNALPDQTRLTPKRTYFSVVKLKLGIVIVFLLLVAAPTVWEFFLKRLGDLPEDIMTIVLYGLAGLAIVGLLVRGLSRMSESRL
jgi:hypothetical protein